MSPNDTRRERLYRKTAQKVQAEETQILDWLRARDDYRPELDYFLAQLADRSVRAVERRSGRKVVRLLCNQAPLELFLAAGLQPLRIASGSFNEASFSVHNWPALTCPLIKGILTGLILDPNLLTGPWVIPSSCDWVVKFWEMRLEVSPLDMTANDKELMFLELPHFKNRPKSRNRWLEEVLELKKFLESLTGRKIRRPELLQAVSTVNRAWQAILALKDLRRQGRISSVYFSAVMGAFFLGDLDTWSNQVTALCQKLWPAENPAPGIFLAGSPIFFPNFKLPVLIEEAGLRIAADDLCSSERVFPSGQVLEDTSEFGLTAALAGRYHQGCLCPTFGDNERRVNNILSQTEESNFQGVVFTVLKGCHPYDLESVTIEKTLKKHGLRYLRLETDYSAEDRPNLLTRLEAFASSLKGVRGVS
ncbi:MAG: 2-hydroxyacyl-CoA dehydratase family protein [Deltaproteobacteria bacterium]|nr:2-hydroxyacyl-CoA dehydratase family protein [Deltaproteobacteria bacterium]